MTRLSEIKAQFEGGYLLNHDQTAFLLSEIERKDAAIKKMSALHDALHPDKIICEGGCYFDAALRDGGGE
jgi:hypothetical protein